MGSRGGAVGSPQHRERVAVFRDNEHLLVINSNVESSVARWNRRGISYRDRGRHIIDNVVERRQACSRMNGRAIGQERVGKSWAKSWAVILQGAKLRIGIANITVIIKKTARVSSGISSRCVVA